MACSGFGRLFRGELTRREVRLRLELAPDIPPLPLDTVQMQQALASLARNAMDAMHSARERILTIRTVRMKDAFEVDVSDTGTGTPPEQVPRFFEPFYSTKTSGTGMGLAICRSIAEAHGGSIRAMNGPASIAQAIRINRVDGTCTNPGCA